MWKRLSRIHPNIVPFLGITSTSPRSMVSQWMMGGNLLEYLGSHPETNRLQKLIGICDGLQALHLLEIVHGDLKAVRCTRLIL